MLDKIKQLILLGLAVFIITTDAAPLNAHKADQNNCYRYNDGVRCYTRSDTANFNVFEY